MMKKYRAISISIFLLVIIVSSNIYSVTKTSTQSGNWSAPSTWGGNPAPTAGDDVIINGDFTITIDIPNATCLSLQIGGSVLGQGTGTLSFTNGSQLSVSSAVSIGPENSNSTEGNVVMSNGGTLICEGLVVGRVGVWTPGTGTVEFTATNIIPNDNTIIFNNLIVSGGTTSIPRNLDVNGNILINNAASIDGGANTLSVGGEWINNGTFNGNTGTVTFVKNGNTNISGTGTNNFNLIKVNLGTNINNVLDVTSVHFNAPNAFLTIINGTFKLSGSFTFANTFFTGPIYNIQPTSGFWINNPNVTVTAQAGGISVRGLLRITDGVYNIGTGIDHSLSYVDGSSVIIEGGELHIAGNFARNNSTQTTTYLQSGGILSVVEQGSTHPTFAGFDLGVVGSSFTMSGGSIVVRNATSAPADFLNNSSIANVTGGTLQIGDLSTISNPTIRIQSTRPIGNLLVFNATAQLITSGLNVDAAIIIKPGKTLNANGLNITLGGNWINEGTFTGGNSVTFNGSGSQAITHIGGEIFTNLNVSKPGGIISLNDPVTVSNSFGLTQGTLAVGNSLLTLNGNVSGGGILTSDLLGTVNYNQSSNGQNVLSGTYGNLTFSNFNKTLASSGIIGIASTFISGTAIGHTFTGSTIDFNGSSQNIPALAYNNLTLSGTGTKSGLGTLVVNGTFTNNAGIIFTGLTSLILNGTTHTNNGTLTTGDLEIGTGSVLNNNGIINSTATLSGNGALAQNSTGELNIGGSVNINILNASSSGNTVNYFGTSQIVKPVTYYNLIFSGSGSLIITGLTNVNGNFTLSGNITTTAANGLSIGGNFTIGNTTTFNASSFSHLLSGNFVNFGNFNFGTSTFTLNGSVTQTLNGVTFNNLSIDNLTEVILQSDETINGILTLSSGNFSIGNHTLNLNGNIISTTGSLIGGAASNVNISGSGSTFTLPSITLNNLTLNRVSGCLLLGNLTIIEDLSITGGTVTTNSNNIILGQTANLSEVAGQPIVGNLITTRNITSTAGVESFGNIGVEIELNGVAPGITTVIRKTGSSSFGNGHSSIKRNFDIVPANNTGLNAGLVFHYDDSELNGQNSNSLELYKSDNIGSTWFNYAGTVNVNSKTISLSGLNDLSLWTASDSSNSIGTTPIPTTISINPASATIGDPGLNFVVSGTNFVSGKSIVRFNNNNLSTSYVNSMQLIASIPATDFQVAGIFPVTVFNIDGGGLSNSQSFTVTSLPPTKINIETLANGTGIIVPAQSLESGASLTVYAIERDSLNNFIANVAADEWILENISGGVLSADLIPSTDNKSAVFTGHVVGTANIKSTLGALNSFPSGTIVVTHGTASKISVETTSDGSGTVAPADSISPGSFITVYSISRDSADNFIANIVADAWSLENITGNVIVTDLISSVDGKSAVFTGHLVGSANIKAASNGLESFLSGTISVIVPTSIEEQTHPLEFALMQNYPNPFNPSTTISFTIQVDQLVSLKVFNSLGEEVRTLINSNLTKGTHNINFDAEGLSSGFYLYRLESDNQVQVRKMMLLK
jgi:hypothetical protein